MSEYQWLDTFVDETLALLEQGVKEAGCKKTAMVELLCRHLGEEISSCKPEKLKMMIGLFIVANTNSQEICIPNWANENPNNYKAMYEILVKEKARLEDALETKTQALNAATETLQKKSELLDDARADLGNCIGQLRRIRSYEASKPAIRLPGEFPGGFAETQDADSDGFKTF